MAFVLAINLTNTIAQGTNFTQDTLVKNNHVLKNLKKAKPGDIEPGTPLMLDPSSTPMYDENFRLIKEHEFMKIITSGDYVPEPYIDSNKVVKAFVFRKATEVEKEQMMKMQSNMGNPDQGKSEFVGKQAEPFSVTDISGKQFTLEKLKGKVLVINFWFVECKPCVMEMPELNYLVDKYKGKEVVFLGFATNNKSKIESFLKTNAYKYNVIANSKEVAALYKVNYYPTHLIIDENSIISYYTSGLGPTTMKDLDKQIEMLLK
jgi:thiol-disulfide isomerase/thioredoxin